MRNFVIGGNWKLKINTTVKTREALTDIINYVSQIDTDKIEIFLALPYTTLYLGQELLQHSPIALAAQNVHYDEAGPYTGEISIQSLKELEVKYILIGHSERRIIFDESNQSINKKVHKVLEHGLTPVLCIGEQASDRNAGNYQQVLSDQLRTALEGVTKQQMSSLILAYEPVWAINNALLNPDAEIKAATPQEAEETHAYIRSWLADNYSPTVAEQTRILYGGSMKPANCGDLLPQDDIDGGLIGSASLSSETLGPIIDTAVKYSPK